MRDRTDLVVDVMAFYLKDDQQDLLHAYRKGLPDRGPKEVRQKTLTVTKVQRNMRVLLFDLG